MWAYVLPTCLSNQRNFHDRRASDTVENVLQSCTPPWPTATDARPVTVPNPATATATTSTRTTLAGVEKASR